MFDSVSRREALRRMTAAAAFFRMRAARAEEYGEGSSRPPEEPAAPAAEAAPEAPPVCTVSAQSVEGPFYFDAKLVRDDISEARAGAPLNLALRVIEAGPCTPLANARVDVWHADAQGMYSGYTRQGPSGDVSTKGQTFLRGTQMTNGDGRVLFLTIYPGWYPGRAPHIHVKILLEQKLLATAQLYFPEILSQRIYGERNPYSARGGPETPNSKDGLFRSAGGNEGHAVAAISAIGDIITATLTISVDRSGKDAAQTQGGIWRWLHEFIAK